MQLQIDKRDLEMTSDYLIRQGALEASPAVKEPYIRLAAAILTNAIRDLKSCDPVRALDAFLWLASDGIYLLRALGGFDLVDTPDLLEAIRTGRIHAKKTSYSPGRYPAIGAAEHDSA